MSFYSYQNYNPLSQNFMSNTNSNVNILDKTLNTTNPVNNNLSIQLMKKDKIILTYSKSLSEQKIKINSLHELLEAKEIETKKLENEIKNLKQKIINHEKDKNMYNEQEMKYLNELDSQKRKSETLEQNFSEKYNESINFINSQEKKINELENDIEKLNDKIRELEKQIFEKNENNENLQLMVQKYQNENKEISSLNSKILEYEETIEKNNQKINLLSSMNEQLKKENLSINSKLNEFLIDDGNKELNFKNQILELTKELSDIKSKFKIKSDELTKLNVNNENINKENENLSFYITCKLNDLNDLFDKIKISPKEVIKYQKEINKMNNKNDIKYEIIEDALSKVKNNIFNLLTDFNSKLEKFENTISELEKQREIKDMDFNSLETESSNLKYQNIDLGKKHEELIKNYQTLNQSHLRLKQLYSEICHDYEILYNQNGKMIDDINAFYERLNGYFISCGINCDNSRLCQGKTVLQNVILFIQKYNKKEEELKNANQIIFELNNKLEEQKNSTLIQIKELTNIIDDSKNIIKAYENENENLKIEFEKLNYQYKMLQNKQIENEDNNELNDSNHKNQIN